jgi:hypothetical protein
MPIIGLEYAEKFAALVAVQVEATWQNRYLKLMDLMKAREGQPNKPCCLAEREACASIIDDAIGATVVAKAEVDPESGEHIYDQDALEIVLSALSANAAAIRSRT